MMNNTLLKQGRMSRPTRTLGCIGVAALLLAGCQPLPMIQTADPGEYRLDAGDTIQIDVLGEKDFSGRFMLDASGKVSLPKAGAIDLRRQTLRSAEKRIAEGLKVELRRPEVAVNIAEYRPIFVTGEVQHPGKFPFVSGMTALKAVALASGYTARGTRREITIVREGQPRSRATEDTLLLPGDTVDVGESLF
jgi:protein involved in polysaccharide export with SLBB domain